MKKLFTLLTLASAFLVANAQVTQPVTVVLDNSNLTVDTSSDTKTATYSENGNPLFTISTEAGTINSGGSVQNLTYNDQSYPALRIGGASNYGGIFTFTFADNVTDVKMYINGNSSSSEQNWYLNGTVQNGTQGTSKLPATGAEPLVVSLADGNTISLGSVRFNVIFVVTYTTTLPLTVSDFSADVTEITSTGATVSVSYSVENAAEGCTYEVRYKDANNEEAAAQSVTADASGATFSLTGLTAETSYKYEVSLYINGEAIENASSTVDFTTLSGPTEPFEINFAELAVNNLTYGNSIGAVSSIPETEGADYTYRDTNERITINGVNSNYQFIVVKGGQEIVSESNLTTSGDVMLRYQNTTSIGLFNNSSGGNRYGILDLKAGDTVEIAVRNGSGANNSVEEITGPTATYNLTEVSSDGVYTLNYTYNQARTLSYKIYSYTVNEDDAVTFTIASTYLAYVKVTPASDEPVEEDDFTFDVSTDNQDITFEDGTITIETAVQEGNGFVATLVVTAPENATALYYKYELISSKYVSLYANEPLEGYEAATPTEEGKYAIKLQEGIGNLSLYYTNEDGTSSEPVSYTTNVIGNVATAVETIEAVNGEAVYYNLNGVMVQNPERGVFIKVQGGKSQKVIL